MNEDINPENNETEEKIEKTWLPKDWCLKEFFRTTWYINSVIALVIAMAIQQCNSQDAKQRHRKETTTEVVEPVEATRAYPAKFDTMNRTQDMLKDASKRNLVR